MKRLSTPTERSPAFGMTMGRTTQACGGAVRTRYWASACRTGTQSQVELLMK